MTLSVARLKLDSGMTMEQWPHAAKIMPYMPKRLHGRCRLGLPVMYNFMGKSEPVLMFKSASYEEMLENMM